MKPAIQVLYKCVCCSERTVTLAAREDGEDIAGWMGKLTQALSNDHALKSPACPSCTMTYVKVPIQEDSPIGASVSPGV